MNIAARVRLLGPALVLLTAALVGLVGYWGYRSLVAEQQLEGLDIQAEADSSRLTLALLELQNDVRLLSRLPAVHELAAATKGTSPGDEGAELWRERVADVFASMLEAKPDYEQLRVIGVAAGGRELIRVQRTASGIVRVPGRDLQAKQHRDYFDATLRLPPGRLYVSDISLNQEYGRLEVPHGPVLRAAVPLYSGDGRRFGLVIINMSFASFIERLFPPRDTDLRHYLTNAEGDFLLHPDPGRRFGFDLGTRYRIQDEFPGLGEIFRPGTAKVTAAIEAVAGGGLIQLRRVYPFVDEADRFMMLGLASSFRAIEASSALIGAQVLVLTLLLLMLASATAYTLATRLAAPLRELTAAADEVAHDRAGRFQLAQRNDEIGTLSRALEHMVSTLRDKERHLEEANVDLEYFSRIASHDLREPARRMAALANLLQIEEKGRVSAAGAEILARLREQGQRMVEQLTDLRAFSQLGRHSLQRELTDIGALVREVLAAHADELEARGVETIIEPLPLIEVYRRLVGLLYTNLVENALQHVPGDGFVLRFSCKPQRERLVLGVSNTGSTVSSDPRRLFEPFHSGATRGEHSGLGLSICRRIVERHTGRIWVDFDAHHIHFKFTLTTEAETGASAPAAAH